MKKLIILVASEGKNADLGDSIKAEAEKEGFSAEIVNIPQLNLPLYSSSEEKNGVPDKAVNLTEAIKNADAIVSVAPEYNGSMPPCLNNAIAWISRSTEDWREAFNGVPVLLATHSGGGGTYVLMAMRQQFSYLGSNVLGRQILTNYGKELNIESLQACLKQL